MGRLKLKLSAAAAPASCVMRQRQVGAFDPPSLKKPVPPALQLKMLADSAMDVERDALGVLNWLSLWNARGRQQESGKERAVKVLQEMRNHTAWTANAMNNLADRLPKRMARVPSPEPIPPPEDPFKKGVVDYQALRRKIREEMLRPESDFE